MRNIPSGLGQIDRSLLRKEVNVWTFELGTQKGKNIPIRTINGRTKQRDIQDSKDFNNDTFCRPPVTSIQCIIGTRKYPDAAILLNSDDDYYSQGYAQIKEAFRTLPKNDILIPYISDHDFRSTNVNDAGEDDESVGYKTKIFDTRYQKN